MLPSYVPENISTVSFSDTKYANFPFQCRHLIANVLRVIRIREVGNVYSP